MPELPEVEIMTRNAREWCLGSTIRQLDIDDARVLAEGDPDVLVGARVERVSRRAKYSVVQAGAWCLVIHYRMTGKVVSQESTGKPRWSLILDSGAMHFVDSRCLGQLWIVAVGALDGFFESKKLGPDPWPERHPGAWWQARYDGLRGAIKPALLRQDRVAGLGNIAAVESLWRAGIAPIRTVPSMSLADWTGLGSAIHAFLHETVDAEQGTGIEYVNQGGPNPFVVYGRQGEPCPRCGGAIERVVQSGRGTWWCPGCQD